MRRMETTKTRAAALRIGACLALALALAAPRFAVAQGQEQATIVVPTPPGGPIDRVARIAALGMQPPFAAVVVENKPGGRQGRRALGAARAA